MTRVARRVPVRLTRRGRAVLLGVLFVLAMGVAVVLSGPGQASVPPGAAPTAVVQPGETLWSIASRYAPSRDPFETIDEIRRLNDLSDYTVHAGQRLTLPGS
jgi:LysM repeat protein